MKVAVVTTTLNDDSRFKEWCGYYEGYKSEIALHIVVDNHSEKEYIQKVKNYFKNSVIIERSNNGGCTAAYNDGIKYALSLPDIDAIFLLANDIKLETGAITKLYKILFSSDHKIEALAPITLAKDSCLVEHFGSKISRYLTMIPCGSQVNISDIKEEFVYGKAISGGANMASRAYYEKLGLQDEILFMYSDEVDMFLRAKKANLRTATTKNVVCWHQHINNNFSLKREPYTKYLAARNKVYLAKKHFGKFRAFFVFLVFFLGGFLKSLKFVFMTKFNDAKSYRWMMLGAIMGLLGKMEGNKYSQPLKC